MIHHGQTAVPAIDTLRFRARRRRYVNVIWPKGFPKAGQ